MIAYLPLILQTSPITRNSQKQCRIWELKTVIITVQGLILKRASEKQCGGSRQRSLLCQVFLNVVSMHLLIVANRASHVKRLIYFGEPLENDIRKYLLEQHSIECFSLYGSTDVGWLAAECDAHDGMHLFADSVLLHLFSETNSTELLEDGTALFTSLFQTGKPNLRYSNGDKLRINRHACSCGRTTPKVYVSCRDTDIFALLGMKISIKEVQHVIYEKEEVSCYFQIELTTKRRENAFYCPLTSPFRSCRRAYYRGVGK